MHARDALFLARVAPSSWVSDESIDVNLRPVSAIARFVTAAAWPAATTQSPRDARTTSIGHTGRAVPASGDTSDKGAAVGQVHGNTTLPACAASSARLTAFAARRLHPRRSREFRPVGVGFPITCKEET